jgi:hypothetical protein
MAPLRSPVTPKPSDIFHAEFVYFLWRARGIRWPVSDRAVLEKFGPGQGLFMVDLDAVSPQVKYSITLRHNLANRSRFLTFNRNTKFHRV